MLNEVFHEIEGAMLVSDIKAEVAAVDLIENGRNPDNIFIHPSGLFKRKFRKDVISIQSRTDEVSLEEQFLIDVSRDGLYDLLPQALFHESDKSKKNQDAADIIDNIKKSRFEENSARTFFSVFEKEFYNSRIAIESDERKSILGFSDHYKYELFLRLWPELEKIETDYLPVIFQVLPLAHMAVGNTKMVSYYLSQVLKTEVEVNKMSLPEKMVNDKAKQTLGVTYLGMDSIIGEYIPDYDSYFEVNIGPVERNQLTHFLPKGSIRNVLDLMYEYFFPVEVNIKENILMKRNDEQLILSPEAFEGRLGYSSRL